MDDFRSTDISIDIETLGKNYNAAVIAIGAAAFNRRTGKIGPTYYAKIDRKDATRHGASDPKTLQWWSRQTQEARTLSFEASIDDVPLLDGLRGLSDFFRNQGASVCPWGNGATFDVTILEHAYLALGNGLVPAWEWWMTRDLRTAIELSGIDPDAIEFDGVRHHAMHDAIHQAKIAIACFKRIEEMSENYL
jgi:hypothetical protein